MWWIFQIYFHFPKTCSKIRIYFNTMGNKPVTTCMGRLYLYMFRNSGSFYIPSIVLPRACFNYYQHILEIVQGKSRFLSLMLNENHHRRNEGWFSLKIGWESPRWSDFSISSRYNVVFFLTPIKFLEIGDREAHDGIHSKLDLRTLG